MPRTLTNRTVAIEIRKLLLASGSATKAELSQRLGVSFPTVTKTIEELIALGEVTTTGFDESSGGRPAKRYRYNADVVLGATLSLEGTTLSYTVFDLGGNVHESGTAETGSNHLSGTLDAVRRLKEQHPQVHTIAVGIPGAVDRGQIFFIPDYPTLRNVRLDEALKPLGLEVVAENDMNAAVLGFQHRKAVSPEHGIVYVYLGKNGPGSGIWVNGALVRGHSHFSGEISFVPLYDTRTFYKALHPNGSSRHTGKLTDSELDAIARLVATFTATLNPKYVIFTDDEIDTDALDDIRRRSGNYIPSEHLPSLETSTLSRDYRLGLEKLCIDATLESL